MIYAANFLRLNLLYLRKRPLLPFSPNFTQIAADKLKLDKPQSLQPPDVVVWRWQKKSRAEI
jgi:hypothetical protein